MNNTRKLKLASALATVLVIAACGNNDDRRDANASVDNSVNAGTGTAPATGAVPGAVPGSGTGTVPDTGGGSAVTASIPDSAKANGNSFIGFLNSLKNDETSEPLLIGDGFSVPADESNEPQPAG